MRRQGEPSGARRGGPRLDQHIRGILRGFGLKVGSVTRKKFEARIRELVMGQPTLERIAGAMLSARVLSPPNDRTRSGMSASSDELTG